MKCVNCGSIVGERAKQCACGYLFAEIPADELQSWYAHYQQLIEQGYLSAPTPWQQSGKSGSYEDWVRLRIPLSEAITHSGTFLDIGCANGFLLECLLVWTRTKGKAIIPYGLDMSEKLVKLARKRLLSYQGNIFHGNALDWKPPHRFSYVSTALEYIPQELQRGYISRLLKDFLFPDGSLLVVHYRSSGDDLSKDWNDEYLRKLGFSVSKTIAGFSGAGEEKCRVTIVING